MCNISDSFSGCVKLMTSIYLRKKTKLKKVNNKNGLSKISNNEKFLLSYAIRIASIIIDPSKFIL